MMIKDLVDSTIKPLLKLEGFKKKQLVWNRRNGDFIQVIDVQAAKGNGLDYESFTINLGVFCIECYETIWQKKAVSFALEVDCVIRVRAGAVDDKPFNGKGMDQWWTIDSQEKLKQIAEEVNIILSERLLPFFDQFNDYSDIKSFVEPDIDFKRLYPLELLQYLFIWAKLGDFEGAELMVDRFFEKQKGSAWIPEIISLCDRIGVNIKNKR